MSDVDVGVETRLCRRRGKPIATTLVWPIGRHNFLDQGVPGRAFRTTAEPLLGLRAALLTDEQRPGGLHKGGWGEWAELD